MANRTTNDASTSTVGGAVDFELTDLISRDNIRDGYTSYKDRSDQDAPTRQLIRKGTRLATLAVGVPMSSPETTENTRFWGYSFIKSFGNQQAPRFKDIEAEASTSIEPPNPVTVAPVRRDESKVLEIMHDWAQEVLSDGSRIAKLNTVKRATPATNLVERLHGHIGWLHSEQHHQSLEGIANLFTKSFASGQPTHIQKSVDSLLKRVKLMKERKFVGGKFLMPGPIRYDSRVAMRYDDDHPCFFFSFPYIAVGNFKTSTISSTSRSQDTSAYTDSLTMDSSRRDGNQRQTRLEKTDIHPIRRLLQTRYRLGSTESRDRNQSIRTLETGEVLDCVQLPNKQSAGMKSRKSRKSRKSKWNARMYVPQLWGLSIPGDQMITSGPLSEHELHSSSLTTSEIDLQRSEPGPSVIRINLAFDKREDYFLYPTDSCESYFELQNKVQKIREHLGEKGKDSEVQYYLTLHEEITTASQRITSENWIDHIRDEDGSEMNIWMQTVQQTPSQEDGDLDESESAPTRSSVASPKAASPVVSIQGDLTSSKAFTKSGLLQVPRKHHRNTSHTSARSSIRSEGARLVPSQFKPFLQWPFTEDEDGKDERKPDARIKVWLDKLQKNIMHAHRGEIDLVRDEAIADTATTISPEATKTLKEANIGIYDRRKIPGVLGQMNNTHSEDDVSQYGYIVFRYAQRLLQMYVPDDLQKGDIVGVLPVPADHTLIKLYWGIIYRLLMILKAGQLHNEEVEMLLKGITDIIGLCEVLHLGVRKYLNRSGGPDDQAIKDLDHTVIQTPIPEAFEDALNFLVDVLRYSSGRDTPVTPDVLGFSRAINTSFERALSNLKKAQNNLIEAADFDKGLGPVVTPEGITILLLERLSQGVYEDGSIDVTELYEKIVEKLSTQVEARPSRRLLFQINRVSEELSIVKDIYKQQQDFLTEYRNLLDPKGFGQPTVKRKARFPYESQALEQLIAAANERINNFAELSKRTDTLADQNVKLVETYQDDNNTTVLIFTLVTVIFVPASFVTSFFGMNFSDLREIDERARKFWWIAVPLTGGVVLASLVLAYWGRIREGVEWYWEVWKDRSDD